MYPLKELISFIILSIAARSKRKYILLFSSLFYSLGKTFTRWQIIAKTLRRHAWRVLNLFSVVDVLEGGEDPVGVAEGGLRLPTQEGAVPEQIHALAPETGNLQTQWCGKMVYLDIN